MGYKKKTLVIVAAVVIVAGGVFYVGAKYEKAKLSRLGLLNNGPAASEMKKSKKTKTADEVAVASAPEMFTGKVTAKNATTLTLKMSDGTLQTVALAPTTTVSKTGTTALASLFVGQNVAVKAMKNADGTFAAEDVSTTPAPVAPVTTPAAPTAPKAQ